MEKGSPSRGSWEDEADSERVSALAVALALEEEWRLCEEGKGKAVRVVSTILPSAFVAGGSRQFRSDVDEDEEWMRAFLDEPLDVAAYDDVLRAPLPFMCTESSVTRLLTGSFAHQNHSTVSSMDLIEFASIAPQKLWGLYLSGKWSYQDYLRARSAVSAAAESVRHAAAGGYVAPAQRQQPWATFSAQRPPSRTLLSSRASRHGVVLLNQGYDTSTGGRQSPVLTAGNGGGEPGHLESHGSSPTRTTSGLGQDAQIRSGETDMEGELPADGGAAQRPLVNEDKEEAKTLRNFFIQTYATLLPASAMAYPVLKDAPKQVKIIIFGGLLVIILIVLFAGILSTSLARRRLAFRLVSCAAVALLTFSVACQLS